MDEQQPRADLTPPGFAPPDARPEPDPRFLDAPPPVPWDLAQPASAATAYLPAAVPPAAVPPAAVPPGTVPLQAGTVPLQAGPVPLQAGPVPPPAVPPPPGGVAPPVGWGSTRPPRRPRRRRAVAAGVAVLVLAGGGTAFAVRDGLGTVTAPSTARPTPSVSGSATASADRTAERDKAVSALIETMNQAVDRKDEKLFASVLLPGSESFRKRQLEAFRGLSRMPFDEVHYEWSFGETLSAGPLGQYQGPAVVARVDRRYDLKGWDTGTVAEPLGLTFTQSLANRKWYLASDTDAEDEISELGPGEPWRFGDVSVSTTTRVMVVGDAKSPGTTRKLAKRLDGLVADVAGLWGGPTWNGRVVVYAVTDADFVTSWFGAQASTGRQTESNDPATFDAVVGDVWSQVGRDGPSGREAGIRMVLTPALVKTKDSAYVDQVLRHELTHVLTDRIGIGPPPAWLVEGIAEYTAVRSGGSSVDGVSALQKRGLTSGEWKRLKSGSYKLTLTTDPRQFYAGSSETVSDHYTSAWFTCLYIADHYGEKKLVRLYTRAAELAQYGTTGEQVQAKAIKEVLGTSPKALTKASLSYAKSLRRRFV